MGGDDGHGCLEIVSGPDYLKIGEALLGITDDTLFGRCERAWWERFMEYERRALCHLADIEPEGTTTKKWADLSGSERERLLFAMRQAAELGDECRRLLK